MPVFAPIPTARTPIANAVCRGLRAHSRKAYLVSCATETAKSKIFLLSSEHILSPRTEIVDGADTSLQISFTHRFSFHLDVYSCTHALYNDIALDDIGVDLFRATFVNN